MTVCETDNHCGSVWRSRFLEFSPFEGENSNHISSRPVLVAKKVKRPKYRGLGNERISSRRAKKKKNMRVCKVCKSKYVMENGERSVASRKMFSMFFACAWTREYFSESGVISRPSRERYFIKTREKKQKKKLKKARKKPLRVRSLRRSNKRALKFYAGRASRGHVHMMFYRS